MKPKINNLLKNYNTNYDQYENLFTSIVYFCRTFAKKGTIQGNIKEEHILTNYSSTKKILIYSNSLICDGRYPSMIKLILENESTKLIHKSESENEIEELILAKSLIYFLLDHDFNAIYETIVFLCSDTIYTKLLPSINWLV